jgi:hypothetical protein
MQLMMEHVMPVNPRPRICLILCQVHAAPGPEQLELSLQLWEMRHGGNQCKTDIDAAREDGPSVLPSTNSRTRTATVCRASSSASASHRAASSTLSCPAASSRRPVSQA